MKTTLYILLFLFPFTLMAQEDAFGPQKKDNLIIITTDTIDTHALEKAVKSLTDMGFSIKEKDAGKGTVTTNQYDYKKGKMVLKILIDSNELKITGEYEPNMALVSGADNPKALREKINCDGNKGSAVREAWNIMDAYSNQLTQVLQGSVSYAKW
jgi:hypothetical protein